MKKATKPEPREIELLHHTYQPNARELKEDLQLEGTFEDAIKALVRPVLVHQVMPPKSR